MKAIPDFISISRHILCIEQQLPLFDHGVPENIVRKISGHAPGTKEFYKYVAIAQDYLNREVKNAC